MEITVIRYSRSCTFLSYVKCFFVGSFRKLIFRVFYIYIFFFTKYVFEKSGYCIIFESILRAII